VLEFLLIFFGTSTFLALIFGLIVLVYANFANKRDNGRLENFLKEKKINISKSIEFNGHYILYDNKSKVLWMYKPSHETYSCAWIRNLLGCEVKIDDNVEYSASISSAAGRAVVGGLVFGGIGAIVGGVTGKKNVKKLIHKVTLTIYFDQGKGYEEIVVFSNYDGVDIDNNDFRHNYNLAMNWCKYIEQLMKIK